MKTSKINYPKNDTTIELQQKAAECGAVLMLPPNDHDDPLSETEIEMAFGTHVVEGDVDFGRFVRLYRQEVHGIPGGAPKKPEEIPSLVDLFKDSGKIDMEINLMLLIAHDSKVYRRHGCRNFLEHVRNDLGIRITNSTLHRRIAHGRLAMVLAARGLIDKLPSQAQAEFVTKLPRPHWTLFCKEIDLQGKGKEYTKSEVARYAITYRLPLRGQRVDAVLPDSDPIPLLEAGGSPEQENQLSTGTEAEAQKVQTFLPQLNEKLRSYLPQSRYESLVKKKGNPARRFLSALKAENRQCRQPERVADRLELLALFEKEDPELARPINAAALSMYFQNVERRLR